MRMTAFALLAVLAPLAPARAGTDWKGVETALGRPAAAQPDGVRRFGFPRTDLAVQVDGIAVRPVLGLGSWLAFAEHGGRTEVMGDLVLTAAEVNPVLEATRLRIADRDPLCVHPAPVARDVDAMLRFRPAGGRMDRPGGIAVRLRDENTYYVLRANAAEDNVRLYHVTEGRRVQFAGRESLPIAMGAWHTLRLRLEGKRFMAWLDEEPLFKARDSRLAGAGRVALWSIADNQTVFEAPRIEVLR